MNTDYSETLLGLKSMILRSRYQAASLANKELLILYFNVGRLISLRTAESKWGEKILGKLSSDLQKELNGLRGFSSSNLKKMKVFYDVWKEEEEVVPIMPVLDDRQNLISSLPTNQLDLQSPNFSSLVMNQFGNSFFSIGFTHHYEIIAKTKSVEERIFYIHKSAAEFWSVQTLIYHLKDNLFERKGKLIHNFDQSLPDELGERAVSSFKDEYLFDFIHIHNEDEDDEREIEDQILRNIKKFLMSLGTDFSFISNQFRVVVDETEYFIDLLFFNRKLRCLVAFELKRGKFKPEYMGKMNFYLSSLDEYVKQPHENPSIGIILCKEKSNKIVEFSFRDFNKAMGVATYRTGTELPPELKNALPDVETLKRLMD